MAKGIQVITDCDGVLLNFNSAAAGVHGIVNPRITYWNWYRDYGLSDEEFWGKIRAEGAYFYESRVQPYPWFDELVSMLRTFGPPVLLTHEASEDAAFVAAKFRRLQDLVPDAEIIISNKSNKYRLANSETCLIDDNSDNVDAFRAAGGNAIEFPQSWSRTASGCGDRMGCIKRTMEKFNGVATTT